MHEQPVYVIDHASKRRNAVCNILAEAKISPLPFESVTELGARWPDQGCFLIPDENHHFDEVMEQGRQFGNCRPVMLYKNEAQAADIVDAVRRGATAYLSYPFAGEEVGEMLRRISDEWQSIVLRTNRFLDASKRLDTLSPRESSVLRAMTEGESNKGIARVLGISPRTVEIHRNNLIKKLDARNSVEAIRLCWDAEKAD